MMEIIIVALLLVSGIVAWLYLKKRDHASPKSRQPTLRIRGDGTYEFAVVGAARFRESFEKICEDTQLTAKIVEAVLIPDDGGRDRKAIRVDIQSLTVGYLPAQLAESYRKRLVDSGYPNARSICSAKISVRVDKIDGDPEYAVRLDLPQKRSND